MKLSDVVRTFAVDTFTDAHSTATIKGFLHPQVDSTGSGPNTTRRILETDNNTTIPTKRELTTSYGLSLTLGAKMSDFVYGEVVMFKYPVSVADSTAYVGTVADMIAGTADVSGVFIKPEPLGTEGSEKESSFKLNEFTVVFSSNYSFSVGDIFCDGTGYYRLTSDSYIDGAGFGAAKTVKVPNPIQEIAYTSRDQSLAKFDPETEQFISNTITVTAFVEPLYVNYAHNTADFKDVEPGDRAISVAKSVCPTVKVGEILDNSSVIAVYSREDYFITQCR